MEWSERQSKELTRHYILSALDDTRPNRILSLPGSEAIFERQLVKSLKQPFSCRLFERETNLIPVIKESLADISLNYTIHNMDVDDYLDLELARETPTELYDLVWLDYCGPLTPLRLKVASRLADIVSPNGTYALTFMRGRETPSMMDIIDAFGKTEPLDGAPNVSFEESESLETRVKTLLKCMYPSCRKTKLTVLSYSDTVPMYVLIFQKAIKRAGQMVPVRRFSVEFINI